VTDLDSPWGRQILEGIPVSRGVASGRVRAIRGHTLIPRVEEGDIVVVPSSHPSYATGVMRASGLICEDGGMLSHICIVAMEMGIPCITQARNALELLEDGDVIVLDANKGIVHEPQK
jgi:phosphoenolpyruvate synthase/pyruvate phosphate dikinase